MRYQRARWLHDRADEPVRLYSEVDELGIELRKVEEYRNGRLDLTDARTRTGSTVLSESRLPSLHEINRNAEFEGEEITAAEFEVVWKKAWDWFDDEP